MDSVALRSRYDPVADAAYIYVKYPIDRGEAAITVPAEVPAETPLGSGINLDFDRAGRLIGIEILGASQMLGDEVSRRLSD